ncbi:MAG: glycosyltransferase [Spirulina sp. SIO3F2]|nr:glycosyltransferase [Spirulina sp. SIO3F2]
MKILLSAFACEPELGSEEGVGWNTAVETAKANEVWVLTRGFCQHSIDPYLARNPIPNLHFVYFEPFGWSEDWKGRQGLLTLHYYLWQIWAYFVARQLHKKVQFDLARHVTYVRYWNPSFLSLLPIPFVWGPVGGGESAPRSFWQDFRWRGKAYELLRDIARFCGEHDPFTRLTARRSAIALVTTEQSAERMRLMGGTAVQVCSEAALSQADIAALDALPLPPAKPIRFISVGRLLHWKAYHLAVKAFAAANLPDAEYWIFGNGPENQALQDLAASLGVSNTVKFWGRVPRPVVMESLGKSHVLVHPSLHDSGGWTCLEGMAAGRPILCLNLGGPNMQITSETGIKVNAQNPTQTVHDLAIAMEQLATDPKLRSQLGQGGKARIQAMFGWPVKRQFFEDLYQQLVESNV